jgi:Mg2+ and Co2+ transporter CorA
VPGLYQKVLNSSLLFPGFESFDETLTIAHHNYLAKINLEITLASKRSNDSMSRVTAVTALFLPLSLFTSLMGINVKVLNIYY